MEYQRPINSCNVIFLIIMEGNSQEINECSRRNEVTLDKIFSLLFCNLVSPFFTTNLLAKTLKYVVCVLAI